MCLLLQSNCRSENFLWFFLLPRLYFRIALYFFLYVPDHHSNNGFFIQIAVFTLLRLFSKRVESIFDHVFIFSVIEDTGDECPSFSLFGDGLKESEIVFSSPFLAELGVDVIEPSFSAIFGGFVGQMISPQKKLL